MPDNRNDIIRALQQAYLKDEKSDPKQKYRLEETVIPGQFDSPIFDSKPKTLLAREQTSEALTINSLSKFLLSMGNDSSRHAHNVLRDLCELTEDSVELFERVYEIAKDVTDRLRSLAPDAPQRQMVVLYAQKLLDELYRKVDEAGGFDQMESGKD